MRSLLAVLAVLGLTFFSSHAFLALRATNGPTAALLVTPRELDDGLVKTGAHPFRFPGLQTVSSLYQRAGAEGPYSERVAIGLVDTADLEVSTESNAELARWAMTTMLALTPVRAKAPALGVAAVHYTGAGTLHVVAVHGDWISWCHGRLLVMVLVWGKGAPSAEAYASQEDEKLYARLCD